MSDDLIGRADAIKAICEDGTALERQGRHSLTMAERKQRDADILEALPPAQPESFEWCHDCKEYDQTEHCCHRWTKVIRQTVEELKAQPERKKGTWIILIEDLYGSTEATCSECGFEMLVNEPGNGLHDVSDLHYCPNCGADMRKDGDHHEG